MTPASTEAVAAKLLEMGMSPHLAGTLAADPKNAPRLLAERRLAGRSDPAPRTRVTAGRRPSVDPALLVGASKVRLRELAREAGVKPKVLSALRARHFGRARRAGRKIAP